MLPGAEEVLALLELRDQVDPGPWDLVVVDCAPTAETLRLLALPEALRWAMQRVFPAGRLLVRAARPLLGRAVGVPMPRDEVFASVQRLYAELGGVQEVLARRQHVGAAGAHPRAGAGRRGPAHADLAVALRLPRRRGRRQPGLPRGQYAGCETGSAAGRPAAASVLDEVDASFAPLPVLRAAYQAAEPIGPDALAELGRAASTAPSSDEPWAPTAGRRRCGSSVRAMSSSSCSTCRSPRPREVDLRAARRRAVAAGRRPPARDRPAQRAAPVHGGRCRRARRHVCGCASSPTPTCGGRCDAAGRPAGRPDRQFRRGVGAPASVPSGSGRRRATMPRTALQEQGDSGSRGPATGHGPECAYCPICQGLALLRGAKPEVAEHLVEALSSLAAAVTALLPRDERTGRRRSPEPAQHIDVSGDDGRAARPD